MVAGRASRSPLPGATRRAAALSRRLHQGLAEAAGVEMVPRPAPAGRLSLVCEQHLRFLGGLGPGLAPLVFEASLGDPRPLLLDPDRVVLVATRRCEPAVARLVADRLGHEGRRFVVVRNRARPGESWLGHAHVTLPESMAGARLAAAGRGPHLGLSHGIARLADLCLEP